MKVALTFDDGPHPIFTPALLEIMSATDVKVTFFVLGQQAQRYPQIIRTEHLGGHEIGNHSWSHQNFVYLRDDAIRDELCRTEKAIRVSGAIPTLMRPPFGEITPMQRRWIATEFGYKTVLWTVDSEDWRVRDSAQIANCILRDAKPNTIILAHDIHGATIEAMSVVIRQLNNAGFEFVTVSQLLDSSLRTEK
jgi:peptidoglycan-N-acetylglucosamine deacetylase